MTLKDRLKDTCDYFGWDFPSLSKFDEDKLISIWHVDPVIEVKHIVKHVQKPMYVVRHPVNLHEELTAICKLYDVTYNRVVSNIRERKLVNARVHFCRLVKLKDAGVTEIQLAHILRRRDHTAIHHYWYNAKADVPIQPFISQKRKRKTKVA